MGEKCFEAEYLPFSLATTTSSLVSSEGLGLEHRTLVISFPLPVIPSKS